MKITEVKTLLKMHGITTKEFNEFMRGQTVGINDDGSTNFYEYDVERFLNTKRRRNN